jgi:spore coat polysaccharide biosynthesis predicted glycosyltransferase SpsG
MKIALRADGSSAQGTGHVMRCLTLANSALSLGHEVMLFVNSTGVPWLEDYLESSGVPITRVDAHHLSVKPFVTWGANRVVIDSYEYGDDEIDAVSDIIPTAVLVDFGTRSANAQWYIDTNLGAQPRSPETSTWLVGSEYSLIRDAIRDQRDPDGATIDAGSPSILVFLGGSDPLNLTETVVRAVRNAVPESRVTAIGGSDVRDAFAGDSQVTVVSPGNNLPEHMGEADIIVSAAGTSAWDVCTVGKPTVFLGLVDNQIPSVNEIQRAGLGPAVDCRNMTPAELSEAVAESVRTLVDDSEFRVTAVGHMNRLFDGAGAERVVRALTLVRE